MLRTKSLCKIFLISFLLIQNALIGSSLGAEESYYIPPSIAYDNRVPAVQLRYRFTDEFADQYLGYAARQLSLLSELSKNQIDEVEAEYQFWNTLLECVKAALDIQTLMTLSPAEIEKLFSNGDFYQVILNQLNRFGIILPEDNDIILRESISLIANLYLEVLKTIPDGDLFTKLAQIEIKKPVEGVGVNFWIGIGTDVLGIINATTHAVELNSISNTMYSSLIAHDFLKANICPSWINNESRVFFYATPPPSCDWQNFKDFISTTHNEYANAFGGNGFPGVIENGPIQYSTDGTFKLFIQIPNKVGASSLSEYYNAPLDWTDYAILNYGNYDVFLATSVIESYFALNNSTMYSVILLDAEGLPIAADSFSELSANNEIKITTPFHNQRWATDEYSAEILAYDFHYKAENISIYKVNSDMSEELITGTNRAGMIVFNSIILSDGENVFKETIELVAEGEEDTTVINRYFYITVSDDSVTNKTASMLPAIILLLQGPQEPTADIVPTITSPTGLIWMDRNLGASRVAISIDDADAYGDLYQWGRGKDGHENRYSPTVDTPSETDSPGHGNFIKGISTWNHDWRTETNDSLWQGANGINNPCPAGFRLPTAIELEAEENIMSGYAPGFNSKLKLVHAGERHPWFGNLNFEGQSGGYWSSTISGNDTCKRLSVNNTSSGVGSGARAYGFSIRCIQD